MQVRQHDDNALNRSEMLEYRPLFAGSTTLEHLAKIFEALGTPSPDDFPNQDRFVEAKVWDTHISSNQLRVLLLQLLKNVPYMPKRDLAALVPRADADALDLLKRLLVYNGEKRLSASAALKHAYFTRTKFDQKIPLRLDMLNTRKQAMMQQAKATGNNHYRSR